MNYLNEGDKLTLLRVGGIQDVIIGRDVNFRRDLAIVQNHLNGFPLVAICLGQQLTFSLEKFYHKFLHNETAFAIQRHLHWSGITNVILPIRIGI
jgi:hypothetical protein